MTAMTVTMVTVKTVTIISETEKVEETEMVAKTMMVEETSLPHTETDYSGPEEEEEEMMIPLPHQEVTLYLRQEEEGLLSLMTRASDSYHKL